MVDFLVFGMMIDVYVLPVSSPVLLFNYFVCFFRVF